MTTATTGRLRVMTWNLHGVPNPGGPATPEQQGRAWSYLAAADVDVALLQEVGYDAIPGWATDTWTMMKGEVGRHGKRCPWGSVIAAKAGLRLREPERLEDDPALVRLYTAGVLVGALTLPDGASACVASVHPKAGQPLGDFLRGQDLTAATGLSTRDLRRPGFEETEPKVVDLVFRALSRHAAGGRYLFGGDWNIARSFGPAEKAFFERAASEAWRDCHALRNREEVPSFLPKGGARQLDHLFCDGATAALLLDCRILADPWLGEISDHAPLFAEFRSAAPG